MKNRSVVLALLTVCLLLWAYSTVEADDVQGALGIPGLGQDTVSDSDVSSGDDSQDTVNQENDYYDALIEQQLKKREYEVYENQIKAQLSDFHLDYLGKLKKELEEKCRIEKTKFDLGYTTYVTVKEAQNEYTAVELQMQTILEWQKLYRDTIQLNGGEYNEITLNTELKALGGDYFAAFKENSTQLISYNQQMLTAENMQALTLLQLQKKEYEVHLQIYVESLQIQYNDVLRQIAMLNDEIVVMETKIDNATALYEKGEIAEIQLIELETELSRLEYEHMSVLCDANRIYHILTNTLEGQEIS